MRQTMRARGMFAVVAATAALLASETVARADEREQCATAADQAQQLRDEGNYRRAREQLLVCARDVCPTPIKRDCLEWLSQLENVAPTIVLAAKEGTRDLSDVKVSVDGAVVTDKLDGKPLQMDLGRHTFKFEYAGQTKEEDVIIGAGQKNRSVSVTFTAKSAAPVVPPPPKQTEGSIVPALVVGGVGVVALGIGTFFWLGGSSDISTMESGCGKGHEQGKGNCLQSDVDKAKAKLLVGDISVGVGLVALGVATYLFLTRPKVDAEVKSASGVKLDFGPVNGGAVGSLGGRF
jgi:hypothetical protein